MAKCPNPHCRNGMVLGYPQKIAGSDDAFRFWYPCPECGGAYGEVSCCSGPEGAGTELPSDPNASHDSEPEHGTDASNK